MSASMQSDSVAEPNLVPILDMVFQLITFFMLVVNMKNASIDQSLRLPVVGSARTVDTKGQEDLLILNVNQDGELVVYNHKRLDWERYLDVEAKASLQRAIREDRNFKPGSELPTTVVIRGAQKLPYGKLHPYIEACQKRKFLKFQFRALHSPPKDQK
jgi:biopolymer transport protein ExbD